MAPIRLDIETPKLQQSRKGNQPIYKIFDCKPLPGQEVLENVQAPYKKFEVIQIPPKVENAGVDTNARKITKLPLNKTADVCSIQPRPIEVKPCTDFHYRRRLSKAQIRSKSRSMNLPRKNNCAIIKPNTVVQVQPDCEMEEPKAPEQPTLAPNLVVPTYLPAVYAQAPMRTVLGSKKKKNRKKSSARRRRYTSDSDSTTSEQTFDTTQGYSNWSQMMTEKDNNMYTNTYFTQPVHSTLIPQKFDPQSKVAAYMPNQLAYTVKQNEPQLSKFPNTFYNYPSIMEAPSYAPINYSTSLFKSLMYPHHPSYSMSVSNVMPQMSAFLPVKSVEGNNLAKEAVSLKAPNVVVNAPNLMSLNMPPVYGAAQHPALTAMQAASKFPTVAVQQPGPYSLATQQPTLFPAAVQQPAVLPGPVQPPAVLSAAVQQPAVLPGPVQSPPVLPATVQQPAVLPGPVQPATAIPATAPPPALVPASSVQPPPAAAVQQALQAPIQQPNVIPATVQQTTLPQQPIAANYPQTSLYTPQQTSVFPYAYQQQPVYSAAGQSEMFQHGPSLAPQASQQPSGLPYKTFSTVVAKAEVPVIESHGNLSTTYTSPVNPSVESVFTPHHSIIPMATPKVAIPNILYPEATFMKPNLPKVSSQDLIHAQLKEDKLRVETLQLHQQLADLREQVETGLGFRKSKIPVQLQNQHLRNQLRHLRVALQDFLDEMVASENHYMSKLSHYIPEKVTSEMNDVNFIIEGTQKNMLQAADELWILECDLKDCVENMVSYCLDPDDRNLSYSEVADEFKKRFSEKLLKLKELKNVFLSVQERLDDVKRNAWDPKTNCHKLCGCRPRRKILQDDIVKLMDRLREAGEQSRGVKDKILRLKLANECAEFENAEEPEITQYNIKPDRPSLYPYKVDNSEPHSETSTLYTTSFTDSEEASARENRAPSKSISYKKDIYESQPLTARDYSNIQKLKNELKDNLAQADLKLIGLQTAMTEKRLHDIQKSKSFKSALVAEIAEEINIFKDLLKTISIDYLTPDSIKQYQPIAQNLFQSLQKIKNESDDLELTNVEKEYVKAVSYIV